MPSFTASIRAAAVVVVIAVATNAGIASASAKSDSPVGTHHVAKAHRAGHVKRHAKKHVKKHLKVTAHTAAGLQPVGIPGDWKLALDSEFTGSSLDTSVWQTGWFGKGVTSPVNSTEQDCYSPSNVTFPGDGSMHLNVTDQSSTCGGVTKPYTGALISSDPAGRASGGFQYTDGVLEARVYVPAGGDQIADWPAVWTDGQNWPNDGEDDLMEGLGGRACWHFHDPLGGPGGCTTTIKPGWHTFASDWQPGSVTYYYDGTKVGSINTGITSSPMYILLDNTVSAHGTMAADSMQVKYVRVWQS